MTFNITKVGRDKHLDGLRGVAALAVVIEHVSALLPIGEWRVGSGMTGDFFTSLINFPFRAGNFSVYVFFVLSGLVLSGAAQGKPWPLSLASRYARLTIPMFFASLMAWFLLHAFPAAMPAIAEFRPNYWTTNLYQHGAQSLWLAVTEPLFGAYITETKPELNPVLWSMRIELWGSLGVFTFYRFVSKDFRVPALGAVAIAVLLSGFWAYLAFVVGMGLYEWRIRSSVTLARGTGVLIALFGVSIGSLAQLAALRYYSHKIAESAWFEADLKVLDDIAGATFVVLGVFGSKTSRNLLTSQFPQFLGRISYGLYLTSMPILYTVFAALYLHFGRPPSAVLDMVWATIFFATALLLASLTTILLDEPATRLVRVGGKRNIPAV